MLISACIVICASLGFVQTVPLNYENPFFSNYDSAAYNELVRATRNLITKPAPESLFLRRLEVNSNSNDDANVYPEGNEFIRLPADDLAVLDPLPQASYFENGIQAALPLEYGVITQNVPSAIVWNDKYNLRIPYGAEPDTYEVDQGQNSGSQETDLYPFVHTSLPASLNPVPPVHTLPPVYATHIHESMPSLETRDDYDIDVMNPENSEMMVPNLRITRSRRDFLENLAHDAMLNNLLPTMPVPFLRGAESSHSYQVQSGVSRPAALAQRPGRVMAVYPRSAVNDCAIPMLLRCSPNIVRGRLSNTYAEQSPQVTSAASYRDDVEQLNSNVFRQ